MAEKHLSTNSFIVSKTDTHGKITYCNDEFVAMSGYAREELIGRPHNIIRHPDMPKVAFELAWDRIKKREEFIGYVKNRCKNGDHYWVYAYITADVCPKSNAIVGYTSFRRAPTPGALRIIEPLYADLAHAERRSGINASRQKLGDALSGLGLEYDELVSKLQEGTL